MSKYMKLIVFLAFIFLFYSCTEESSTSDTPSHETASSEDETLDEDTSNEDDATSSESVDEITVAEELNLSDFYIQMPAALPAATTALPALKFEESENDEGALSMYSGLSQILGFPNQIMENIVIPFINNVLDEIPLASGEYSIPADEGGGTVIVGINESSNDVTVTLKNSDDLDVISVQFNIVEDVSATIELYFVDPSQDVSVYVSILHTSSPDATTMSIKMEGTPGDADDGAPSNIAAHLTATPNSNVVSGDGMIIIAQIYMNFDETFFSDESTDEAGFDLSALFGGDLVVFLAHDTKSKATLTNIYSPPSTHESKELADLEEWDFMDLLIKGILTSVLEGDDCGVCSTLFTDADDFLEQLSNGNSTAELVANNIGDFLFAEQPALQDFDEEDVLIGFSNDYSDLGEVSGFENLNYDMLQDITMAFSPFEVDDLSILIPSE